MPKKFVTTFPGRMILLAMLLTILTGAIILSLPISQVARVSFLDSLFTATSSACLTGLLTVPLSHFSTFGQCIIFALMQLGGIGLMTITIIIFSLFVDIGLRTQLMTGYLLELESIKRIKNTLIFIFLLTIIIETIGAIIVFFIINNQYPLPQAIGYSIFHSVSSFCNTGLTLFENGFGVYSNNFLMLLTTGILMITGSLGFIFWHEVGRHLIAKLKHKRPHRYTLQTRIIISMTIILIVLSSVLFLILEYKNSLEAFDPFMSIVNSLFNAISMRSTGMMTTSLNTLQLSTIFLIMIFAFIGGSPGSTGSGIRITTFTVFLATARTVLTGKPAVIIKGRSIPVVQMYKAISIVTISLAWIIITTFCLLITETGTDFLEIIFEATSAFTNLGMSTGITPYLSKIGKSFLIASMLVGRIGSLTLALALIRRTEIKGIAYPEEKIMLS